MNNVDILAQRDRNGRTLFRVTKKIRFQFGPYAESVVPRGYVSNLGSVPRIPGLWWFVSPVDYPLPFIHHDHNSNENVAPENFDTDPSNDMMFESGMSRWMADSILYEHLCTVGVPFLKRYAIWIAVRLYARYRGLK